jgi:hypothetical protein
MREWPTAFGETVAFVTKHGKERLLEGLLARHGLTLHHLDSLDTDRLGTFTREVPRQGTALDAARQKLAWGLQHAPSARFALASEGSFGPHPQLAWVAGGHELVLLKDRLTGLELRGEDLTQDTNFGASTVGTLSDAVNFARRHGFPAHALIVGEHKAITVVSHFEALVAHALARAGSVHLETDMRAHLNPMRQRAIRRAMERCFEALSALCPQCAWPGFVISERRPGLKCEECGTPTALTSAFLRRCVTCGHVSEEPVAQLAPAARCDQCNP